MTVAVEAIIIQFSGSSDKWIPRSVWSVPDETHRESNGRKAKAGGVVAIEPTEQVSVADVADLLDTGFTITNVLRQMRVNRNQPGKKYHMLRYVIHPTSDRAEDSLENIKGNYPDVESDFVGLLNDSLWRVRAYHNPQESGGVVISINLELRVPLLYPDGEPIKVYPRDEAGNKVGPAEPIRPAATLKLSRSGALELV